MDRELFTLSNSHDLLLVLVVVAVCVAASAVVIALFNRARSRAQGLIKQQNVLLDSAINNMIQGLCMFDAQNRLLVWNERYREMYKLPPSSIWHRCSIRDLLNARIEAGTFPLDPDRYEAELKTALKQRKPFRTRIELADGRTIAGVNQPMEGGGWVATHEDITDRVRAERELDRTRVFLDTIVSSVPTPIVVKELPDLRYRLVNKAAEKFFGIPAEGFIGKTSQDVFGRTVGDSIRALDDDMVHAGRETYYDEHLFTAPGGESRIITSTRLPILGADGKAKYLITVLHDVTQRKRDEARISYLAQHDALTELPNRVAFNECLDAMISLAPKSGHGFALLCIDLDRFKDINDVFGHSIGDALMRMAAKRLEQACEGSFLARLGGDEFAVISPTGPQPEVAESLAARITSAMGGVFEIDGHRLDLSVTVGISLYPMDGTEAAALIANADAALYRAKSEARGSVSFFKPDMDKKLRSRRALQHDLRSALANDELELYYQPIARADGEIVEFEALARWHHPREGTVPPSVFIPLAEDSELIDELGEWVLRTACREAASWPRPLDISVNLSPAQFRQGDLPAMVHAILLETGLKPNRLKLEVTEGVLIQDFSRAVSILRRLKGLGACVSMDDFGTGYSSLSYLQAFPFDKIKLDQAFTMNLNRKPQSAAIATSVIGLAHALGVPVVAEGVETEEQRKFLLGVSCDQMQGYLIGRPKPIEAYAGAVGRSGAIAVAG